MIAGFSSFTFRDGELAHSVHVAGEGPPIIVMHEIPGLHPGVIAFGRRLVAEGFRVFMPSLFGRDGQVPGVRSTVREIVKGCVSREFACLALRRASPVTEWLRALARHAHEEHGLPVGAIGMCFTGGFALAMAVDDHLMAPVLCQPSVPFPVSPLHTRALGLDPQGLARVKQRCEDDGLCVLGLRFTGDWMAPHARFERLHRELGDAFIGIEIDSSFRNAHGNPLWAHSVLTHHLVEREGHPTTLALERTLSFFRERLKRPDELLMRARAAD